MLYDAEIESYQKIQNCYYFVPRVKNNALPKAGKIIF